MTKTRTEHDLLGAVVLPHDALFGAQTQRAVENFPLVNERSIGSYPTLLTALLQVKKAAAVANQRFDYLPDVKAEAIIAAIDVLLTDPAPAQFPIHALHGGGGTSANMNANEVLANLAEERLGGQRGRYQQIHPNDHVNLHQSTNDIYPTACRIAVIAAWVALDVALSDLGEVLRDLVSRFGDVPRISRTCWQDAVDTTYGDLFGGYASVIDRHRRLLAASVHDLHTVNLGGGIVGRDDAPVNFRQGIVPALCEVTGDPDYRQADNLFDAAQHPDDLVRVSAGVDSLARTLVKIAKELRILSSGPEAGLGEIILPAVQPGSSIMPGKINPVIPEFLIQLCFTVMGKHVTCAAGLDHGEADLNIWESSMTFALLDAFELLITGIQTFSTKCLSDMTVDREVNVRHSDTRIPKLTRLMHVYGYARVTGVYKQVNGDMTMLEQVLTASDTR